MLLEIMKETLYSKYMAQTSKSPNFSKEDTKEQLEIFIELKVE